MKIICSGVVDKKSTRGKVAIFWHTLQISDEMPTNSCKFLTEEITGAKKLNCVLKFSRNWVLVPNFAFLDENFL